MSERCPNCGSAHVEQYCASCGQRAAELRTPVSAFLREALDDVFSFDSRIWRTLIALFRRPGSLTADYWEGRRARFVTPLRLYLIVSFVSFLFLVFTAPNAVLDATGTNPWAPLRIGSGPAPFDLPARAGPISVEIDEDEDPASGEDAPGWFSEHVFQPALDAPERAQRLFHQRLQWTVFAQVPLFALWLRLLYRRRERFFVPHLVFALHFHTLAFVLLVAGTSGTLMLGTQIPSAVAYLALLTALFWSLRRVYAEGVLKTLVKQLALVTVHFVTVVLGLMALLTVTGLTV
ncbi:MAG: DUF3667 domain-containing protein [Acidobacteriota bacterium]|nr:DUF3667 domain-containing protein [Acidobacteriota bacterium]